MHFSIVLPQEIKCLSNYLFHIIALLVIVSPIYVEESEFFHACFTEEVVYHQGGIDFCFLFLHFLYIVVC